MSTNQLAQCTDWEVIQQEYIQGGDEVTCEVLAVRHGVHKTTVKKHCSSMNWAAGRRHFRYQTATLIEKRTKEELAERHSRLLNRVLLLSIHCAFHPRHLKSEFAGDLFRFSTQFSYAT